MQQHLELIGFFYRTMLEKIKRWSAEFSQSHIVACKIVSHILLNFERAIHFMFSHKNEAEL
jgi:hypothetical protein